MWKLPKSITILGKPVPIIAKPLPDLYGKYSDGKIYINPQYTATEQYESLIHEIMHAILDISGMAYVIGCGDKEEGIVRALEGGLIPVIRKITPPPTNKK